MIHEFHVAHGRVSEAKNTGNVQGSIAFAFHCFRHARIVYFRARIVYVEYLVANTSRALPRIPLVSTEYQWFLHTVGRVWGGSAVVHPGARVCLSGRHACQQWHVFDSKTMR